MHSSTNFAMVLGVYSLFVARSRAISSIMTIILGVEERRNIN